MAARKRMGRPRKPKGEAKDETLTLRLTRDERKAAEAAAISAGLAVSEWARRVLVDSLKTS